MKQKNHRHFNGNLETSVFSCCFCFFVNDEIVFSDLMLKGIVFQSLGPAIVKALSVEVFLDGYFHSKVYTKSGMHSKIEIQLRKNLGSDMT